jgi:hypothetical protein
MFASEQIKHIKNTLPNGGVAAEVCICRHFEVRLVIFKAFL